MPDDDFKNAAAAANAPREGLADEITAALAAAKHMAEWARETGDPALIEWCDAVVAEREAWFRHMTGKDPNDELKNAELRLQAARRGLTPEHDKKLHDEIEARKKTPAAAA